MRDLGLGALAHANRHAAYAAMENLRWPDLSVLQAAHGLHVKRRPGGGLEAEVIFDV